MNKAWRWWASGLGVARKLQHTSPHSGNHRPNTAQPGTRTWCPPRFDRATNAFNQRPSHLRACGHRQGGNNTRRQSAPKMLHTTPSFPNNPSRTAMALQKFAAILPSYENPFIWYAVQKAHPHLQLAPAPQPFVIRRNWGSHYVTLLARGYINVVLASLLPIEISRHLAAGCLRLKI